MRTLLNDLNLQIIKISETGAFGIQLEINRTKIHYKSSSSFYEMPDIFIIVM